MKLQITVPSVPWMHWLDITKNTEARSSKPATVFSASILASGNSNRYITRLIFSAVARDEACSMAWMVLVTM